MRLSLKEIGAYFENGNIESLEGELRNTLDQIGTEDETAVRTERGSKTHAGVFEQYRGSACRYYYPEYIPRRSIIVLDRE